MSMNDNKIKGYDDENGDNIEGEKNYELRTVINLSQPKKKVKLEENWALPKMREYWLAFLLNNDIINW